MKLAIITNILTPYRVPLFQALSRGLEDCTVLLMADREENRQWAIGEVPFSTELLPGWHLRTKGAEVSLHVNYGVVTRLRRLNPDVVLSGGFAPAHLAAFAFCKLFSRRYVQWGEFSLRDGAESSHLRRLLRRIMVSGADACIASSTEARDAFLHYGARGRPILMSPMPVEVERIHEQTLAYRATPDYHNQRRSMSQPILLSVGRLTDKKGYPELFAMYERVVAIRPEVSLLIVGDGPDRPTYESLCRQKGWGHVHFVGHVESKDLPRYLALADLFVFPTLSDTFGAVLSEAMAAELPVLASVHAAATYDLVDDGVTGYRFDPQDPATGAETILTVLALSNVGRTEMGRAAYRRVRSTDIGPSADVMAWFLTSQLSEPSGPKTRSWFPWLAR